MPTYPTYDYGLHYNDSDGPSPQAHGVDGPEMKMSLTTQSKEGNILIKSCIQCCRGPGVVGKHPEGVSKWVKRRASDVPGGTVDRSLPANAEDTGSIPDPGRPNTLRSS